MDPFDDILPVAPAHARAGSKFMPKAKLKQPPRKEISASEHATPSKDGNNEQVALSSTSTNTERIYRDECHNAVASTLNTSAEESMRFHHPPQVEPPNLEDDTNSEMGNPQQVSVERDTAALVDGPPSMITESEVDADWNFTNHTNSACEVESMEFEMHPFRNVLLDPGARSAHKFLPKIKPRPRVGTTPAIASASSNDMIEKSAELPTSCTNEVESFKPSGDGSSGLNQSTNLPLQFSEDNNSFEAVIPSQLDSPNAMLSEVADHNGTRDWPSSFGRSAGETADIFCGLESLDDFLTHAATDTDPTSEIPVHEELTNASDSPTLADFLHADVAGEKEDANKRQEDGISSHSLRKDKRSSIAFEKDKGCNSSRELRKHASRKPANNPANEDIDNDDDDLDPPYNPNRDELLDNDDEFEVDDSSKKQRASSSSKEKSAAKNGKTSQKRKKVNEDLEKTTKQPRKKFSHSTRRRKRCVDKALLEIPEDELDPLTLPIKDIILLAEYRERLAKKEASTSKTPLTKQSGGDFHNEAGDNNEEMLGSEDDRDPDDDEARESIPTAASLFNYQSFMDKAPRGKWSKQDTELFYEALRQFGTDFSMIQELFPGRTRHQIKLKYKKEERQHPLQLSDAVNSRGKDHSHFKLLIERLQQASTKAKEQDPSRDASDFMTGNEVEDLTRETYNVVGTTEQADANVEDQEDANVEDQDDANVEDQEDANVKDQEDANVKDRKDSVAFYRPERGGGDDDDDDDDDFSWYKSAV